MLPALEKEVQLINQMRPNKLKLMTLFCLADESVSNSLYQEYTNRRATSNTNNYTKCCKKWVKILEKKTTFYKKYIKTSIFRRKNGTINNFIMIILPWIFHNTCA